MVPLSSHSSLVMGIYATPWWWLSTVVLTHSWVLGSWFDSTKCPLTQSGLFTVAIALLLACDDQLFFYSIATLLSVCMHTVNSTLQSHTLRTYVHTRYLCTLTLVCVCACCACVCVCGVYVCMCVCVHDLVFLSHCRPHLVASPRVPVWRMVTSSSPSMARTLRTWNTWTLRTSSRGQGTRWNSLSHSKSTLYRSADRPVLITDCHTVRICSHCTN